MKKKKKKKEANNVPEAEVGNMNDFFEELASLKEIISCIKLYVEEIRGIHDRTLNNVISEQQSAGKMILTRYIQRIGCSYG